MAGLFGRKKKDDSPANANAPSSNAPPQQQHQQQQRPPPSPNGLNGITGSSGSMQGGIPTNGYNDHASSGPRSPMSPSFPQHSNSGFGSLQQQQQQQQQPHHAAISPMNGGGPPSPKQPQYPGFAGPPGGTVASATGLGGAGAMVPGSVAGALMTTPQLFWTQRRILGSNPFPRYQHSSSIIANGTDIYLYGGSQRGTTKGDLFVIDSGKPE